MGYCHRMASLSCPKQSQAVYRPRRPEKTVLHEAAKKHFSTWRKNYENTTQKQVPCYIDNAFQKYLGCGILAKGFAYAHCEGCHKDLIIPFSCKARGLCPSCNTRTMVQTASHLVENVLPRLPFRQFVMSFPMRIRHYLETHQILQVILKIVVDEIRKTLISCSPNVPNPQIGAISFIQYFGNTLNYHPHFHLVVADGIFSNEQGLLFHKAALTPDDVEDAQERIQRRVLRYFCKRGYFDKDEVEKMLAYENSGFSLNANVKIESFDKDGLERLIRYCARPPFASENLRWSGKLLIYRFPKPSHTGKTYIQLDPLDFIDRISKFIPYPRRHRHHFHGAFAPSSPLRTKVAANAQKKPENASQTIQGTVQGLRSQVKIFVGVVSYLFIAFQNPPTQEKHTFSLTP